MTFRKSGIFMACFLTIFYSLAISVIETETVHAASFNDTATGDWDSGATWGNGGDDVEGSGYPGTADTVVIDSHTVTLTADTPSIKHFELSGGTFTMDSYTLTLNHGNFVESGGTFNEDTGTVIFLGSSRTVDVNSSLTFNNLTINKDNGEDIDLGSGDTLVVNGTLTLTDGEFDGSGTVNAKGPISVAATFDGAADDEPVLLIDGSSSQSFTVPDGASLPAINLNQSATTIDFDADAGVIFYGTLTLQAGTFISTSGTLAFVFSAGIDTSAGGTFNHNSGLVAFSGLGTVVVDVNSSLTFNNLTINKAAAEDLDIASGDTLVVNGILTLVDGDVNDGTIEAKGDITVASTFDGGTANYTISGTGAQTITGSSATISDTGTVTFANTGVVSLGANTTITTLVIAANGTLDLAGFNLTETTFTNSGTLQLEGGETVNEPDTHSASSTVEYNDTSSAQTLKTWTYTNLKINAAGQTVSMGTDETLGEGLTVKAGTFDVADKALSINATTTINGGTMMTGNGVVTFGDASSDIVRITSGTLEIESDDTTNDIVKTAGTWTNSGGTISYTGNSVTTDLLSALSPYNLLTINDGGNASTYTLDGAINASSTLTITGGTLDANGKAMIIEGDWVNNDTFTANANTVTLIGTNQTISGPNTFYNFTKSTSTADTLTIANGTTQTVTNIATLNGAAGQLLTLVSDSPGTAWSFDPQSTRTFDFLAVTDSNNTNATAINCYSITCTDSGGNTNWDFTAPVVEVAASNGVAILPPNFGQITSPLVVGDKTKTLPEILLITKTLSLGSESQEVLLLQKFLNTNGFILTDIGLGSPGNETSYFGVLTQSAVQRYQCANSIVCTGTPSTTGYGVVGPRTRASLANGVSVTSKTTPQQNTPLVFTRPLYRGVSDSEVTKLQELLASDSTLYPEGLVTGYFGALTKRAVERLHDRHKLARVTDSFYGFVGPQTRVVLNGMRY